MLDTFTIETFQPRLGETFRVIVDDQWELRTRLSEVYPWGEGASRNRPRIPFSLVFLGPLESNLQQAIYRIEHDTLEPFEAFLVPIGPDQGGMRYEAVFT